MGRAMEGWTQAIDAYCERMGPEFWAEPFNAVTNAAFVIGGILPLVAMLRRGERDGLLAALCLLSLCIGVGSFLFHTYAQRWAALADTLPILVFILVYLVASMLRLFGLRGVWAYVGAAAALGLSLFAAPAAVEVFGNRLNGSQAYAPALALLAGSALALKIMGRRAARPVAVAASVFAVSLTARILDPVVCGWMPIGTHFLWHVLNGTMICILLFTLLNHGRRAT